jgi:hypothetical protein
VTSSDHRVIDLLARHHAVAIGVDATLEHEVALGLGLEHLHEPGTRPRARSWRMPPRTIVEPPLPSGSSRAPYPRGR